MVDLSQAGDRMITSGGGRTPLLKRLRGHVAKGQVEVAKTFLQSQLLFQEHAKCSWQNGTMGPETNLGTRSMNGTMGPETNLGAHSMSRKDSTPSPDGVLSSEHTLGARPKITGKVAPARTGTTNHGPNFGARTGIHKSEVRIPRDAAKRTDPARKYSWKPSPPYKPHEHKGRTLRSNTIPFRGRTVRLTMPERSERQTNAHTALRALGHCIPTLVELKRALLALILIASLKVVVGDEISPHAKICLNPTIKDSDLVDLTSNLEITQKSLFGMKTSPFKENTMAVLDGEVLGKFEVKSWADVSQTKKDCLALNARIFSPDTPAIQEDFKAIAENFTVLLPVTRLKAGTTFKYSLGDYVINPVSMTIAATDTVAYDFTEWSVSEGTEIFKPLKSEVSPLSDKSYLICQTRGPENDLQALLLLKTGQLSTMFNQVILQIEYLRDLNETENQEECIPLSAYLSFPAYEFPAFLHHQNKKVLVEKFDSINKDLLHLLEGLETLEELDDLVDIDEKETNPFEIVRNLEIDETDDQLILGLLSFSSLSGLMALLLIYLINYCREILARQTINNLRLAP